MEIIRTKSQATVDIYEFLAQNKEDSFTLKEIAEALDLTTQQVTGSVVGLTKKGVLTKGEIEQGDKVYKTYKWAKPVEFTFDEAKTMSEKSIQVLQFLQENADGDYTAADIAAEIGTTPIAVNGVINALVKKGYAYREEAAVEMPDGKEKILKFVKITPAGEEYKF